MERAVEVGQAVSIAVLAASIAVLITRRYLMPEDQPVIISTQRKAGDKPRTKTVVIDGEEFVFERQKAYPLFKALETAKGEIKQFEKVEAWLFGALPEDQAERLRKRLEDPEDDLDVPHLVEVFQGLVQGVADRPTTRSRD